MQALLVSAVLALTAYTTQGPQFYEHAVESNGYTINWKYSPYSGKWDYTLTLPPVVDEPVVAEAYIPKSVDAYSVVVEFFGRDSDYVYYTIINCETGGTYNRFSVGREGERGYMQIHPMHIGLIHSLGYTWDDMFSVYPNIHVGWVLYKQAGYSYMPWSCR